MTTQKEMSKMNRMIEIIKKEKKISKVQLVMRAGISVSYYDKLKPFLEEIFTHVVKYNKETKMWEVVETLDEPQPQQTLS